MFQATSGSAQVSLLALCSRIIPSGAQGATCGAEDGTRSTLCKASDPPPSLLSDSGVQVFNSAHFVPSTNVLWFHSELGGSS